MPECCRSVNDDACMPAALHRNTCVPTCSLDHGHEHLLDRYAHMYGYTAYTQYLNQPHDATQPLISACNLRVVFYQ